PPPYGAWAETVAGQLNWTKARGHIGPVMWDVDGGDWQFWRDGKDPAACAAGYIDKINRSGRGIILMHDSSFEDEIRANNRTFDVARTVVAWLQANDYRFVRPDSVPKIVEAARVKGLVALQTRDGRFISPQQGGGGKLLANSPSVGAWEPLGIVELGEDRIALRCLSGHYLSVQPGEGGQILANAPSVGLQEVLTREDLGNGRI